MKKLAYYRPAIACFILMMVTALQTTGLSFFVSPVSQAIGVGRGSFTLYFSIMSGVSALSGPFMGRFAGKYGVRRIMLISAFLNSTGFFILSFSNQLWMFYATAAVMGITASGIVTLCATIGLQSSYDGSTVSNLLGIVMAGSGVGGMLVSAMLGTIIEQMGWQFGYRCIGAAWMLLSLLAFAIMGSKKAENDTGTAKKIDVSGMTSEQAMRSPKLYLSIFMIFVLAASCGVLQHLPSFLQGQGFDTAKVSAMMGLTTAMLAVGKIAQGFLYGSAGVPFGGTVTVGMFVVSYLLLLNPTTIYPGLILLAIGLGTYTTLMPLEVRYCFGSYDFAAIWGIMQAAAGVGSFVGAPTWGLIYDTFGSYQPAMLLNALVLVLALAAHFVIVHSKKTVKK